MNEDRLHYLIALSIANKISADEIEEMADLIALPENEALAKQLLLDAYQADKQEVDIDPHKKEAILSAIYQSETVVKKTPIRPLVKWLSAAAAILITFSIGLLFFSPKTEQPVQIVKQKKDKIVPGGNKAILTLADGSKITLDDAKTGEIANQGLVQIIKTADGKLAYQETNSSTSLKSAQDSYNVVETPRGGKYQVTLPDGTMVWLNAASILKYPVRFKGAERRVELIGEAYFEVAHNEKLPFRVVSNKQTVEVLGTHFNIQAYNDESVWKTTLLEGSVRISSLNNTSLLKPVQQAQVTENGTLSVSEANIEEALAWKNGYFRFHKEGIETIMRKISRWYDVDIEFKGAITDEKFNGTSSFDKNIEQVLEVLETTEAVHFKIEGRRIIVMK